MSHVLDGFKAREVRQGYRNLIERLPEIVEIGRDVAYTDADSYRDFRVGDVAVGIAPGHSDLLMIPRANYKSKHLEPDDTFDNEHGITDDELHGTYGIPRDIPKVCAEMATILSFDSEDDFEAHGYIDGPPDFDGINKSTVFFLAHVTIGTTDQKEIEAVTGTATPTLPPCDLCTTAMFSSVHTSSATLVISAGMHENIVQVRTKRQLYEMYRTKFDPNTPVSELTLDSTRLALGYFDKNSRAFTHRGAAKPARLFSALTNSALNQSRVDIG